MWYNDVCFTHCVSEHVVGAAFWVSSTRPRPLCEDVRDAGWLLSFLWALWRVLIIRVPSSGSCPLRRHVLPEPPPTPAFHPLLHLLAFLSDTLFFLLQAKVKLILFHNFLSARFLPRRLHLWLSAWKMRLGWRRSEYLCLTKWIMFFSPPYRLIRCMLMSYLIKSPPASFLLFFEYEYGADAGDDTPH